MNARGLWSPEVGFHYGIKPWEMHRLTVGELAAMNEHHRKMREQADG